MAREPDKGSGADVASVTGDSTARYLRGSSVLLVGRLFSLLLNFGVQVLTVRYLAKNDFGAFAYALAVASMGASVVILGLNRGVNRFVPIDHEHGRYASMFGTMLMGLAAVSGLGLALVVGVIGLRGLLVRAEVADPLAIGLLVVLIGLAPLQALDNVLQGLVATFAKPRVLCVRRFIIGPGLKLGAVLAVIAVQGSVTMLAWCYLLAGLLGVVIYVLVLVQALGQKGLLETLRGQRPDFAPRRLLGFSLPLMSTDIYLTLHVTIAVVLLEHFRGATDVAELRAVAPIAGLCAVAVQSFKLLFTPLASRLFARGDHAGLNDLYWRSTLWITLATFPVFAVCLFLARPVTVLLFGERYAGAAVLLAILSIGVYFNAALGLNLYVLQAFARVRAITAVNIAAMVTSVVLAWTLIPPFGAVGAAWAITGTVAVHNVLVHGCLAMGTGVELFRVRYLRVYATIGLALGVLFACHAAWGESTAVMASAVVVVTAGLALANRDVLEIADAFPQLGRLRWT